MIFADEGTKLWRSTDHCVFGCREKRERKKETRKKKNKFASETSRGVSHLAGKLPRCSTKSRGNFGDYAVRTEALRTIQPGHGKSRV